MTVVGVVIKTKWTHDSYYVVRSNNYVYMTIYNSCWDAEKEYMITNTYTCTSWIVDPHYLLITGTYPYVANYHHNDYVNDVEQ